MFQVFSQFSKDLFFGIYFESMFGEFIPKIETLLKIENKYFSIILTDDKFIKKINKSYRNKNYATDVISFPSSDVPLESIDSEDEIGEIYISVETAVRQAENFVVSIEDEMKRLVVHGILHLMGFDHERSREDEIIMNEQEDFILERI